MSDVLPFPRDPPPGPFGRDFWRSPLRGPWLTSIFGAVLLLGIPVMALTGLLSYAAYNPDLGANDTTPAKGALGFYLFHWVTHPAWLYRLTQGTHLVLGIVLIPILLAKLWSVIPRLFEWPPVRTPAHALERASLALLVGGAIFEFATGLMNIDYFYPWPFSFYDAHLYGAWVFLAGFGAHVVLKLPVMLASLRGRSLRAELQTSLAETFPEAPDEHGLVATRPAAPTISRRGVLALVGGGSLSLFLLTVGGSLGGPLRRLALLSPRGRSYGSAPNDFQINKTALSAHVSEAQTGTGWRLTLAGVRTVTLSRSELDAMNQTTHTLPIACVEGWSTSQTWTGVPLRELARLAGAGPRAQAEVRSLERGGLFGQATLDADQVADPRTLLALRVNGAELSLDHGYPARMIVPAAPGVHNTKWVRAITFHEA